MTIFDLTLKGALHLGEFVGIHRETVLDWVPADTLFAALVVSWQRQGKPVEERLQGFLAGRPPFCITSLFPRAGKVRFFPAPGYFPAHCQLQDGKAAKRVRWISKGVLDDLCAGRPVTGVHTAQNGMVWLTADEWESLVGVMETAEESPVLWKKQVVPHVVVDRQSSASNLFHSGRVLFGPQTGLWFAARGECEWVRQGLQDLQDSGLGGLRSTGHGNFCFEESPEELPEPSDGWGICLSRLAPARAEDIVSGLQTQHSVYRFVVVGGWCHDADGHTWRRRSVRMIAEGALLPVSVQGQIVDVTPVPVGAYPQLGHAVYRYGWPFFIPAGHMVEAT